MSQAAPSFIDVRTIVPRERHPVIFGRFHALQPGETFDLVNDHDPRPLYYQMQAQNPDSFTWTYLESGPEIWRVRIGKTAATAARPASDGNCCSGGSCG
ncbi:MAG: DUF2249 domain-containing protein [Gammaproteobacteria bacterium]|nr:MAG: DUF2249 domain-containing protein [Gammaproteobacteria bacterium]